MVLKRGHIVLVIPGKGYDDDVTVLLNIKGVLQHILSEVQT